MKNWKFLGILFLIVKISTFSFTLEPEEQEYTDSIDRLEVGIVFDGSEGFYINKEGQLKGLAFSFISSLANSLSIDINIHPIKNSSKRPKGLDILISSQDIDSLSRKDHSLIFARKEYLIVSKLGNRPPYSSIGVSRNRDLREKVESITNFTTIREYTSPTSGENILKRDHVDALLVPRSYASISTSSLQELDYPIISSNLTAIFKDKELLSIANRYYQLKFKKNLRDIQIDIFLDYLRSEVLFTFEEYEYLKSLKLISVLAPQTGTYLLDRKDGKYVGNLVEILNKISIITGVPYEIKNVGEGYPYLTLDIINEDEKFFFPYNLGILSRAGEEVIGGDPSKLSDSEVGYTREPYKKGLESKYNNLKLNLFKYDKPINSLIALQRGHLDYVVGHTRLLTEIIQNNKLENLSYVGSLPELEYGFKFNGSDQLLVSILNKSAYLVRGTIDEENEISKLIPAVEKDNSLAAWITLISTLAILFLGQLLIVSSKRRKLVSISNSLGKTLSESISLEEIGEKLYLGIKEQLGDLVVAVGVYDKNSEELYYSTLIEYGEKFYGKKLDINTTNSLTSLAIKSKKSIYLKETHKEIKEYLTEDIKLVGSPEIYETYLHMPLEHRGEVIGCLTLAKREKDAFKKEYIELFENLSGLLSIALSNFLEHEMLYEEINERKFAESQLIGINRVAKLLNSTTNISEVGIEINRELEKLVGQCAVGILRNLPNERIIEYVSFVEDCKELDTTPLSYDSDSLAAYCITKNKDIIMNDVNKEANQYLQDIVPVAGSLMLSVYYSPLIMNGELIGAFTFQEMEANKLTPDKLRLIENLKSFATLALNNQIEAEKLKAVTDKFKNLSRKDELTGMPNRRHFYDIYNDSWSKAIKESKKTTVMLLDLDNFKLINDTYGHLEGDLCLKKVADILIDKKYGGIFGRIGGDEFIGGFINIDPCKAFKLAENIRKNIANIGELYTDIPCDKKLGVSIGLGTVTPLEGQHLRDFIKSVDEGLYTAKEMGKNQTYIINKEESTTLDIQL